MRYTSDASLKSGPNAELIKAIGDQTTILKQIRDKEDGGSPKPPQLEQPTG